MRDRYILINGHAADESVAYAVYDGRWTWTVVAVPFAEPITDDTSETVRGLTATLIERRGG